MNDDPLKQLKKLFYLPWDLKKFTKFGISVAIILSLVYISLIGYTQQKLAESFILNRQSYLIQFLSNITTKSDYGCDYGPKGPRILCAVFTYQKNYDTKAVAVNKTWGKRCDSVMFMTSIKNEADIEPMNLNLVHLNITNSYSRLTDKTIQTILYARSNFEFDWLLKADDDTFVLVDNLRYFLSTKCPDDMNYYGYNYKPNHPERFAGSNFNSGGAGYLLSKKVVDMFSEKYLMNETYCKDTSGSEDVDISNCLEQIEVTPGETRDRQGRERFHPLNFKDMWSLSNASWTFKHSKHPVKTGEDGFSETSISFHYTSHQEMYQLDFLLYKLKHKNYQKFNDIFLSNQSINQF